MGEGTIFLTKTVRKLDIHIQKSEFGLFTIYTKNNSQWIKDLNLRAKSVKLLGENVGKNLYDIVFSFMDMTPIAQTTKKKKKKSINWVSQN